MSLAGYRGVTRKQIWPRRGCHLYWMLLRMRKESRMGTIVVILIQMLFLIVVVSRACVCHAWVKWVMLCRSHLRILVRKLVVV